MPQPQIFLLVDDEDVYRAILARTLLQKVMGAAILQCEDSAAAIRLVRTPDVTAVMVRQASDATGLPLIESLRRSNPTVPIVCLGSSEIRERAFLAGANAFLRQEAWASLGTTVQDMLRSDPSPPATTALG